MGTAVVAAFPFVAGIGDEGAWQIPAVFGAAILMILAGVRCLSARLGAVWLAVLGTAIPLVLCALYLNLSWPLRVLGFAGITAAIAWGLFMLETKLQRNDIAALLAGVFLLGIWGFDFLGLVRFLSKIPASAHSLSESWMSYVSLTGFMVLGWILIAIATRHAALHSFRKVS